MSNDHPPLLVRSTMHAMLILGLGVGTVLALLWLTVFVLSNDRRIETLEEHQFRLLENVEAMRRQMAQQPPL